MAKALERLKELTRALLHRSGHVGGALEQIRAADVSREDEITGESAHRHIGGRPVGDDEREMLRRVAGRVSNIETHAADIDRVAIMQQSRAIARRITIAPVR